MNQLIGMRFSPWTERARWALDHHGFPYRFVEYTTLLGEPRLRLMAGKPFGKVSVPLLVTPTERVNDSLDIARFADQAAGSASGDAAGTASGKAPLVPADQEEAIRAWADAAEGALCAARIRATRRISESVDALADRLPAYAPGPLRKPLVPMAWIGARYILLKYRVADAGDSELYERMDAFFGTAEKALAGRRYLFDEFGFADIVVATALQALTPVDDMYIYLGAPSRACMCEPALATKYSALLDWRDRLYREHR